MNRLSLINGHVQASKTAWVMKNIENYEFFPKGSLKGKTLFITGASRGRQNACLTKYIGIGLAIGLRAAQDGKDF